MISEIEINGRLTALTNQRNNALNQCAILEGEIAVVNQTLLETRNELDKLTQEFEEYKTQFSIRNHNA